MGQGLGRQCCVDFNWVSALVSPSQLLSHWQFVITIYLLLGSGLLSSSETSYHLRALFFFATCPLPDFTLSDSWSQSLLASVVSGSLMLIGRLIGCLTSLQGMIGPLLGIVGKRREGKESKKKEDFVSALADGECHLLQERRKPSVKLCSLYFMLWKKRIKTVRTRVEEVGLGLDFERKDWDVVGRFNSHQVGCNQLSESW